MTIYGLNQSFPNRFCAQVAGGGWEGRGGSTHGFRPSSRPDFDLQRLAGDPESDH